MQGQTSKIYLALALPIAMLLLSLSACHVKHPTNPTSVTEIQSTLNTSIANNRLLAKKTKPVRPNINNALLPELDDYVKPAKKKEDRFDVSANRVPAQEFFMSLVADTKYNMVVNPNITGTISLKLKNVTIKQVMEAIKDIYGYEYHSTSYGYEVLAPQLATRLFHINYLDIKRTGRSYIQLTSGQVSNVGSITVGGNSSTSTSQPSTSTGSGSGAISSIETTTEMEFWKNLEKTIQNIIAKDEDHRVTLNSQTGVIAVRAYPNELRNVEKYIDSLQHNLNRQVILEAKVLEVELSDDFQSGIDWGLLSNPAAIDPATGLANTVAGIGQDTTKLFEGTSLDELEGGVFAIRMNGNFRILVNLLQTQGNVQVLSSPHISTVNNQKAVIKVGQDEFFVTGVSTSNTVVGSSTIPSQDVSLTPFFSGITLDVTPEISSDDTVVLHIHPSISSVTEQTKLVGLGTTSDGTANNLTLPLAKSTIRESDNVVRAKNGQTIVIGGLMQNNMSETLAGTPGISKVPFLGSLFRRTKQKSVKSELIILLRPIVASNRDFTKQLKKESVGFTKLKRPFHQGGLTKIFGNEAERNHNF